MNQTAKPSERPLREWEIAEARLVFGNRMDYSRVRIHENVSWPNFFYRLGLKLRGLKPKPEVHNAITLGNHSYFPVQLPTQLLPVDDPMFYRHGWLMHELTHVWQYQQMGWGYLPRALKTQLSEGPKGYHFGGEDGLRQRNTSGARLTDFNLEQQGDIVRSYYERIKRGQDTAAWHRYIAEVQDEDSGSRVA